MIVRKTIYCSDRNIDVFFQMYTEKNSSCEYLIKQTAGASSDNKGSNKITT